MLSKRGLRIGLEVHAQLASQHKLFSPAPNRFDAPSNTCVDPFDMAYPGILPVLNRECVHLAIRAAVILNCTINRASHFDRKHYHYHDLPHGFQITQERVPIAVNGSLDGIAIERIQLEQDSAKSIHFDNDDIGIDLNRAGVGLLEIVTGPSMRESGEAMEFAKHLRDRLKDAAICLGEMEAGHLRFDVNVSMIDGQRVEIKNLNSFVHLREAIEYERGRQEAILDSGEMVARETRSWDPRLGITTPMRLKQPDYRFMPEYDLPNLLISEQEIEMVKQSMPESRAQKIARWNIKPTQAQTILDAGLAEVLEAALGHGIDAQMAANWLTGDYLGVLSRRSGDFEVSSAQLVSLLKALSANQITAYAAKGVLVDCLWHGKLFSIPQVSTLAWEDVVREEVERQPERMMEVRQGKRHLEYFMGPIMRRLKGTVDPMIVRSYLNTLVSNDKN